METCLFCKRSYRARNLIESTRLPCYGFDAVEISSNMNEDISFCKETYCARILMESTRFPPFGFDTVEISSNSNEDMSFSQKDFLCPDSNRERSVSPLRI